jgi:protein SCO1/2
MSPKKRVLKILILVLILAVPGFLYYLLTAEGKNRYKPLPIFGPKHLAETSHTFHGKSIPDTVFHQVNDFDLLDQDGKPVSFKMLQNQILVINFFYTHCADDCRQMMGNMDSLATYYARNKRVTFLSITVDPERDSPEVLKSYASNIRPAGSKWLFLTGDVKVIDTLANKGLLVDALQNGDTFIHSDKLIMLDPEHRIRGYYSGTSVDDVNRLTDELKVQISEELRKIKAPNM